MMVIIDRNEFSTRLHDSAGQAALVQDLGQILLDNQPAPRRVDQSGVWSNELKTHALDQSGRLGGQRAEQADDVRPGE